MAVAGLQPSHGHRRGHQPVAVKTHDHAEITAFLANRVALEALSGIAARKKGLSHDPAGPLLEGR